MNRTANQGLNNDSDDQWAEDVLEAFQELGWVAPGDGTQLRDACETIHHMADERFANKYGPTEEKGW